MAALSLSKEDCPVCGTPCEAAPLYEYTAARAAAHFCPPVRDEERNRRLTACIRRLWGGDSCAVMRCGECGFGFSVPFVGGDEEFYGILHEQKGYPQWKWDFEFAHQEALGGGAGGKVLDIGAGDGAFLRSLADKWERYAVEGSEDTRKALEKDGITVFRDLEAAAQESPKTFQIVTLFQVLEHLSDFRPVLSQAKQLLAPGGRIVITVPDGDAMITQERCTGCPDMPPNHVCKWTPRSLSLALEEAGFQPGDATMEPASLGNLGKNMHLKVLANAAMPGSISSQVYRIPERKIRIPFLAVLGCLSLISMAPHLGKLRKGGAFAMLGVA